MEIRLRPETTNHLQVKVEGMWRRLCVINPGLGPEVVKNVIKQMENIETCSGIQIEDPNDYPYDIDTDEGVMRVTIRDGAEDGELYICIPGFTVATIGALPAPMAEAWAWRITNACRVFPLVKDMLRVKESADDATALFSCQGQAMDGISELANYRDCLKKIEVIRDGREEFRIHIKDEDEARGLADGPDVDIDWGSLK